jgi:eukaryotic-like serine/threonine-protein kinase
MHLGHSKSCFLSLVCCSLVLFLPACGFRTTPTTASRTPTTVSRTPTTGVTPSLSPTVSVSPQPLPPDCPPAGKGRVAMMPPMTLGGHQNIVYIVDERQGNTPTFGTLKRYDVTTGSKTEIIKIAKVSIYDAQISTDGQWILFVAASSAADKLQIIRVDGQDLQTLYCAPQAPGTFYSPDWSPDERLVSFVGPYPGQLAGIYILNLQSGSVQLEAGPFNMLNSAWLDNTHLYMMPAGVDARTDAVYMLDLSRGANQPSSNGLVQVFQQAPPYHGYGCVDYDTYGGSKLLISQCTADYAPGSSGIGKQQGPSSIGVQLPPDASLHSIFTSPTLAITMVRAISSSTLLLLVDNFSGVYNHSVDTSQNGLWKINMDGSGLARLTARLPSQYAPFLDPFCAFTRTPWANGSRDGSMYAIEVYNNQSNSLLFGSLSGGPLITLPDSAGLVGWTTM